MYISVAQVIAGRNGRACEYYMRNHSNLFLLERQFQGRSARAPDQSKTYLFVVPFDPTAYACKGSLETCYGHALQDALGRGRLFALCVKPPYTRFISHRADRA